MPLEPLSPFERHYLWIQVCEQLKFHNKGADVCIDTLNRLWRKNQRTRNAAGEYKFDLPVLTIDMLTVAIEHWTLAELVALEPPHPRDELKSYAPPIVLSWFNTDFLMDGNTRVNAWKRVNNPGPHAVLRISERVLASNISLERTREG
jgi:hypothetical protein